MSLSQYVDQRRFEPILQSQLFTSEQLRQYNEEGYLVLRAVIPTELIDAARSAAGALMGDSKRSFWQTATDHSRWITSPDQLDSAIAQLCQSDSVGRLVRAVDPEAKIFYPFLYQKKMGENVIKPWHQDGVYWGGRDANVFCYHVPLTALNRANGALRVIPRSHLLGRLYHHEEPGYNLVCDVTAFNPGVEVELEPGDVMLCHSLTVHASFQNFSNQARINLGLHCTTPRTQLAMDHLGADEQSRIERPLNMVRGAYRFIRRALDERMRASS